jgi:hypothetical protein
MACGRGGGEMLKSVANVVDDDGAHVTPSGW